MNAKLIIIGIALLLLSCGNNSFDDRIIGNWKVKKMEKMIKINPNDYGAIEVKIDSNMAYNFMPNNKVQLISMLGKKLKGSWFIKDSIISITIEDETKEFNIIKLDETKLIMGLDRLTFYTHPYQEKK